MFPLVVVVNGKDPHLVYQKNLETFLREHADATFIVPAALKDEVLNSKLAAGAEADNTGDAWYGHVKIERRAADRQALELFGTSGDDYRNAAWYEARPNEIVPHFHNFYFGPGSVLGSCFPAVVVTFGMFAGALASLLIFRRRRNKPTGSQ
ncbi:MAG: hypothetical protein M3041_05690 [Acidobacteriota bacterium]|nr:hypothetical protein [Acidobacteriota bacterium]